MKDVTVDVTVDHGAGPSSYSVAFHPEEHGFGARFEFDLIEVMPPAGMTSPDAWTAGWLTWASGSQIIVAFAAPYIHYAGWLVLEGEPPDEMDEDDSRYWEALATRLVTHTFALDRPGNAVWAAASCADRLPQGRAYSES